MITHKRGRTQLQLYLLFITAHVLFDNVIMIAEAPFNKRHKIPGFLKAGKLSNKDVVSTLSVYNGLSTLYVNGQ